MNFTGFTAQRVNTLRGDIASAGKLAQRCVNRLAFNPSGLDPAISSLLSDMFGTTGNNANQLAEIRRRFAACGPRLMNVNYTFTTRQSTTPSSMGHVAFIEFNTLMPITNEIFVTPSYFAPISQPPTASAATQAPAARQSPRLPLDRVLTLIHEFIHLFNGQPGHPGGQFAFFMRFALNLNFADAVLNPYSYEGFARYLP